MTAPLSSSPLPALSSSSVTACCTAWGGPGGRGPGRSGPRRRSPASAGPCAPGLLRQGRTLHRERDKGQMGRGAGDSLRKGKAVALYTIGDTHLSLGSSKPMDVFGEPGRHVDKLPRACPSSSRRITLVIAGDISWGMSLRRPRRIYLAGYSAGDQDPHEGQTTTIGEHGLEMNRFFPGERVHYPAHSPHNNCHLYGETGPVWDPRVVLRGVTAGPEPKVFHRELQRLETSSKRPGTGEKLCFLHYPLLHRLLLPAHSGPADCLWGEGLLHGHLHGPATVWPLQGN